MEGEEGECVDEMTRICAKHGAGVLTEDALYKPWVKLKKKQLVEERRYRAAWEASERIRRLLACIGL